MRNCVFLHPELLSREAPDIIMAKIKRLTEMKEEYHELNEARNNLEKAIAEEEKELENIRGVLYDYVDEPEEKTTHHIEKVNLVLKGLSNSKI